MKNNTRLDVHRPSTIVPADYRHVMEYGREWASYDPDFGYDEEWSNMDEACELYQAEGAFIHGEEAVNKAILRCDVCGARFKYGSLFRHSASGVVLSLGHDCANNMGLAYDLDAADRIQRAAKQVRLGILLKREKRAGLRKFAQDNKAVLPLLRVDHAITRDIRAKLISTGAKWGLSARQVDLLRKLAEDASKPAEKHVPVPVDGERIRVEGTVVSLKVKDTDYGITMKMTVKVETSEGSWLVWGTAPEALMDLGHDADRAAEAAYFESDVFKALPHVEDGEKVRETVQAFRDSLKGIKGRKVGFTAKVTRGSDEHFGFFSRPTKPELLG